MRFHFFAAAMAIAAASAEAQTLGTFTTSGSGCVARDSMVYELFPAGVFDLDNSGIEWIPNGVGSYILVPATGMTLPFGAASTSAFDIVAADDTVNGPHALTFTFPYPAGAGATNSIDISPNGHIYLEAGTNTVSRCCNGTSSLNNARTATPAFSIFGNDLNASTNSTGQGTIWMDEQTVNSQQVAVITWDNVGEFGVTPPAASHNCQIQLWDDGRVVMYWFGHTTTTDNTFVGWSAGNGQPNPDAGPDDLSVLPIDGGDGVSTLGLALSSGDTPTIGETFTFQFSEVPAMGAVGAVLFGSAAPPSPIDLSVIGADGGCMLQTLANIPIALQVAMTPPTGMAPLPISSSASGIGLTIETQGAVISPGSNALGLIVSNAGTMTIGDISLCPTGISVTANGPNTFNSITESGFWSVCHNDPTRADIASVSIDLQTLGGTQQFDTDQTGMAQRFDGGNSSIGTCQGTYRNNSDQITGLDYTGTAASPCDPGAMTGWTGSVAGSGTADWRVLDFAFTGFTSGERFEFDADTDNGSTTGAGMAGTTVTITLTDSTVLTGQLVNVFGNISQIVF